MLTEQEAITGNSSIDDVMISLLSSKNKQNYIKSKFKLLPMWYWSMLLSILSGNDTDVITDDDSIRTITPKWCNPLITKSDCMLYNNLITDLYMADTMTWSFMQEQAKVVTINNLETLMIRLVKNYLKINPTAPSYYNSHPEHFEHLDQPLQDILNDIYQRDVAADIKNLADYNKIASYIHWFNIAKKNWVPMKDYTIQNYSIHETYQIIMDIDPEENQWVISVQPIFDILTNRVIAMNVLIGDTFVIPLAPRSTVSKVGNKQLALYIATEYYYHNNPTELGYVETSRKLKVHNTFTSYHAKSYTAWVDSIEYEWFTWNVLNKWLRYYNVKYLDISWKIGIAYLADENTNSNNSIYSRQLWLLWYNYMPSVHTPRKQVIQDVSCTWTIQFI